MSFQDIVKNIVNSIKTIDRNTMLAAGGVVVFLLLGGFLYLNKTGVLLSNVNIGLGLSDKQIAMNAIKYINDNGLSQSAASLINVSEESGLVKMKISIAGRQFDSYVTKDGKFLIPQALGMVTTKTQNNTAPSNQTGSNNQTAASVKKTNSPMLEAFVVARCPYGLQMQRAIAEAVKNVPSLAQYVKVRYIGAVSGNTITSMHGDAEAQENLRQICIREEQSAKYWSYVSCQMKSGDTAGCEKSTGIDSAKLSSCVSTPSKGIAYAKKDFDLNAKYGVQGSPTLILNGTQIDESGFGGRSADGVKNMVCSGFNSKAGFCSTKLNTAEAAVSFSNTYSSGSGSTANTGAGCAPAQ